MTTPSPSRDSNRIRILFAEDDLDQAHLVKYLLEVGGDYQVVLVQDGHRAISLVREQEWDLVITDLNLPGADGTRVVEAARARHPDLPILATTGYTGPQYSQRAVERGADAVLIKPLHRDELLDKVRRLVEDGRPPRRAARDGDRPIPAEPADFRRSSTPALRSGGRRTGSDGPAPDRRVAEGRSRGAGVGPADDAAGLQVLVLGVHPGEAEAGCGGTLLRHRKRGDRVVLLHLAGGAGIEGPRRAAKEAARRLGIRTFVGNLDPGEPDHRSLDRLVTGALRELRPEILYLPTHHHRSALHRSAHALARESAGNGVRTMAYDAGDVTPDFVPDLFVPLSDVLLDRKVDSLIAFHPDPAPHVATDFVRAGARYWSRFTGGSPAEALECLEGSLPFPDLVAHRRPPSREPA